MAAPQFSTSLTEGLRKHVVVVGAGIVGASTAWHLARKGFDVTLLDREVPAALDAPSSSVSSWGLHRRVRFEDTCSEFASPLHQGSCPGLWRGPEGALEHPLNQGPCPGLWQSCLTDDVYISAYYPGLCG